MRTRLSLEQLIRVILIFFIIVFSILSAWLVLHNDIRFNTDIARDFLLLENVADTRKLTLIGPRSGGLPGVFHGPLWLYLNLPAFIIGGENPIAVGWFWVALTLLLMWVTYVIASKLYNARIGLFSAVLVSGLSVATTASLFNPFGAVLLFPLFFFLIVSYCKKPTFITSLCIYFVAGLLIQFQIAFGGPILFLTGILSAVVIWRKRRYKDLLSPLILLLPLSTYIVFELRHNFLQLHAIEHYLSGSTPGSLIASKTIFNRIDGIKHSLTLAPQASSLLIVGMLLYFAYILIGVLRNKVGENRLLYAIFFYFFIGYWLVTIFFRGVIWDYYYWPFLPVAVIVFCSGIRVIHKYLFYGLFALMLFTIASYNISVTQSYTSFIGSDAGSWLFNKNLALSVFNHNDKDFGYYVFSPDEFGYSPRYAMDYVSKHYADVKVYPYEKRQITYLLLAPGRGDNTNAQGDWWVKNRVKIDGKPERVWVFPNKFRVQRYLLTNEQRKVPSDPNLIENLIFR